MRWALLIAGFLSQSAFALTSDWRSPLSLTKEGIVIAGHPGVYWSEGERGHFNFDQFNSFEWNPLILPKDMGAGRAPIWYRFSVKNDTGLKSRFILGSMESHTSDFVVVYVQREDGTVEDMYSGTKLKQDLVTRPSTSLDFPISLMPNEVVTITMGISSIYGRNLLFKMSNEGTNRTERVRVHIGIGIEFGLFIFAISFNSLAWFAIRKRYNLIFAMVLAFTLLAQFLGQGYATFLAPTLFYPYTSEILILSIALSVCCRGWFAAEFLEVKNLPKPIAKTMRIFLLIGVAVISLSCSPIVPHLEIIKVYSAIMILLTAIAAVSAGRNSKSLAPWVYLTALTASIVGGTLWLDAFSGQTTPSNFNLHFFMATGAFETALITIMFMTEVAGISKEAKESARNKIEAERMNLLVNVLSHDLKNLTSTIKGAGERILKDSPEEGILSNLSRRIVDAVNRQFAMLASVQKLVNLNKGSVKLSLSSIDLHHTVLEIQELFQEKLSEKNLSLMIKSNKSRTAMILAERESLLHSVIGNIFYNAIKFSPSGGDIVIQIESTPSAVRLSIQDKGIGMPPAMMERLFQPAHLPSRLGTNGEPGSGFGLSICKAYMDMYDGTIEVSSRSSYDFPETHGTIVTLNFRHAPNPSFMQAGPDNGLIPRTEGEPSPD